MTRKRGADVDARTVLQVVLYVFLIVLSGVGVWALVEVIATARSTRRLTDDLGATLPSLIRRADGTLDAVNAEIQRVDVVVSQFEEVSENVVATRAPLRTSPERQPRQWQASRTRRGPSSASCSAGGSDGAERLSTSRDAPAPPRGASPTGG